MLIIIMENKKYYSAYLHYLGHKRDVVISLDLIDSYLALGYVVEILRPVVVITAPASK